ncbi:MULTISPECIES: hypothetical protein [unclassified Microcoleus]
MDVEQKGKKAITASRAGKKRDSGRRPIGRSTNLNFADRPPLLSIPS